MKRKKFIKNILLLIPAFMLMLLNSCKHDDLQITKENENLRLGADFIRNNYDMTLFYAAIQKAGMADVLNGQGPFTILVPSNSAFQQLGITKPSDFDKMNSDSLKGMIQRHVLTQRLLFSDIPVNGVDIRYQTLAGTEVYASLAGYIPGNSQYPANNLYFNGSSVTRKDVNIANGIIQVINKVMKYTPRSTVQDWLASRPQYSIFVSGLKKFGLWSQLNTTGPFTVFAPQNNVFEAQNITAASIMALDTAVYSGRRLFGGYIINKKHYFISDINVFYIINSEPAYVGHITGDSWYQVVSTTRDYFTADVTYSMNLRTPINYPYDNYPGAAGLLPALTDNLTDNGLVHDIQGLLLLPVQALK
ncbi:fasciclin domain-containing protein [Mucilaginibacter paludis]|nr:fasciclin domain-containing protein [Mucilaginibacter paludis]